LRGPTSPWHQVERFKGRCKNITKKPKQKRQDSKLWQRVFSIETGGCREETTKTSLAQKGSIIINHVFSEAKKNYGSKFTLHLAFFYCFTFYAGFPHWMAFGRLRGFMQPSAPIGPFLRRPSLGRRRRRWHGNSRGIICKTFYGFFFRKLILSSCESDPNRRERSFSKAGPPAHFTGQESPRDTSLRSERARPSSVW